MTTSSQDIIAQLRSKVGASNIQDNNRATEHYRSGWRSGGGDALCVVFPKTLVEYWAALEVCVAHKCIIIMQAANTGLTEGSAPSGSDYDRPVVIINTLGMDSLVLLGQGEQIISFPGTTLHHLEKTLNL